MKKEDFDLFDNMIGCYFNQDFDLICGDINNAIEKIILNHDSYELNILISQIEYILNVTKNEKKLEEFLKKIFHIEVTPKVGGDDMNNYTELLEYIRDNIQKYLKTQNLNIT